jgi:hypothetical protein
MIATDIRLLCALTRLGTICHRGCSLTLHFEPVEITGKSRRGNVPKMEPEVKDRKA